MYETASIRKRIKEISGELRNVVHCLLNEESQSQETNMRSIDAKLLSVFTESTEFVKSMKHSKELDTETKIALISQYEDCISQIKNITQELAIKEELFLEEISKIKNDFKSQYEKIVNEFKISKNDEIVKHKEVMKLIQEEIDRLNSSFEITLAERVNNCLAEKAKFQSEFEILNQKYIEMKNRLENELKQAELIECQTNNKLKEMEIDNQNNLLQLEKENQNQLEERESDLLNSYNSLLKESENIKSQMANFDSVHNNDLRILQEKVEAINIKNKAEIEKVLSAKKSELSLCEKNILEQNSNEEMKLKEAMIKVKSENQIKIESIKQKLTTTKEQVAAVNAINAEKIKVVNAKAQREISEVNSKRTKLVYDQNQILELTKKRYLNDLKQQQKRGEAGMAQSKQRLQQLQGDFDNQKKRLEGEVIALIKKRNRLQLDLQNLNANGGFNQSVGFFEFFSSEGTEVIPGTPSAGEEKITTINQMVNKFQTFDKNVNKKLEEIRGMKIKNETEIKSEKQKLIATLDRTKNQLNTVVDEVRLLKIRKEELINKLKMQEVIKKADLVKNENELKLKIQNQRGMIRQLTEELQKIRTDDSKKQLLAKMQADHRKETKMIQDQIEHFNDDCRNQIELKMKEMNDKINKEKEKSADLVMKMLDRIKEALHELTEAKKEYEDLALQDQQRWMKLRKEIIDTNLTILGRDLTQNESKKSFSSIPKSISLSNASAITLPKRTALPRLNQ